MIRFVTRCAMRTLTGVRWTAILPWPTERVSFFVVEGQYIGEAVYRRTDDGEAQPRYEFAGVEP